MMKRIDELRQQIDACRAGGDDLHLPELAGLAQAVGENGAPADPAVLREFERSQQFDRAVVSALQEVAVPAGMLDRLLAKTTAAEIQSELAQPLEKAVSAAVDPIANAPAGDVALAPASAAPWSRRWFLTSAVAAGLVAAGIAVVLLLQGGSPQKIELAHLVDDVRSWVNESQPQAAWERNPPVIADLEQYRIDSVLRDGTRAIARWRTFKTVRGEAVVAYDLSSGGDQATLFVVRTHHTYVGVAPSPPLKPIPGTTGGLSVGAWQTSTGLLYVLVVERGLPLNDYLRVARPA